MVHSAWIGSAHKVQKSVDLETQCFKKFNEDQPSTISQSDSQLSSATTVRHFTFVRPTDTDWVKQQTTSFRFFPTEIGSSIHCSCSSEFGNKSGAPPQSMSKLMPDQGCLKSRALTPRNMTPHRTSYICNLHMHTTTVENKIQRLRKIFATTTATRLRTGE